MSIRKLKTEDINQAYLLETEHTPKDLFYAFTKQELLSTIEKQHVYGFFLGSKLIGKIGIIDTGSEGFEVDGLVIHKKYRRKRLAKKLMHYLLKKLNQLKVKEAFLLTHPKNFPAINLYLQFGFVIDEWLSNKFGPGKHRIKMIKYI